MRCCDLTAGKLRTTVIFERETRTSDGAGGSTITWAPVATVRAWVKPMSGGERIQAMRIEANVTHRVYIRYRSDLRTSDRLVIGNRLFQVRAIIDIEERKQWLEVFANEGQAT